MESIPMKYSGHLIIDVKVNSINNGKFIFDTGWNGIALDSSFCQRKNMIYKTKDYEISGIGNLRKSHKLITDTINFEFSEKERRFSTQTLVLNVKDIIGKKASGIAGVQTFSHR